MEDVENSDTWRAFDFKRLESIPPRPRRGVERIEIDTEPVRVRGEALDEVWWRGKQWAVTAYGIERLDGTYVVEASELSGKPDYLFPMHMATKIWVDVDEFTTAWMVAILLHGQASAVDPAKVRAMFGLLRPRRLAKSLESRNEQGS